MINAYSTLNRGDAVILDGVIASLRAAGAKHITVAMPSGDGEEQRRLALGADAVVPMVLDLLRAPNLVRRSFTIHAVWMAWTSAIITLRALIRPDSHAALRAYREADLIVSSGGAYLGGPRPGINFLTAYQIRLADLLGRECVVAPVTIKPMNRPVARIVRWGLRRAVVFARDESTVVTLRRLGIKARLASDLAFRSPAALRARGTRRPRHREFTLGWAPRQFGWDSDAYRFRLEIQTATKDVLTRLVREKRARILVIAQSNAWGLEDDSKVIDSVLPILPPDVLAACDLLPAAESIDAAIAQYARVDVLYAYRLHAAILALMARTPSVVIDYEPKVRGVFEMLGIGDWVIRPADAVHSATVLARLTSLTPSAAATRIAAALALAEHTRSTFDEELARRLRAPATPAQ